MSLAPSSISLPRPADAAAPPVTVIEPAKSGRSIAWRDVWAYRELGWVLALRDIQVRYKQTLLGAAWAVIQPFGMMVVATIVFGKLLGLSASVEGDYTVHVFAGMLPWALFAGIVTASSNSLVNSAEMIRKIYFPRLLLPLSSAGAPLMDFAIATVVLLGLMVWAGVAATWALVLIPLVALTIVMAALAIGIGLAALNVSFRDCRLALPFTLQLWFFFVPVVYQLPVGDRWQSVLSINPVYGPVRAMQAAVQGQPIDYSSWAISLLSATALGVIALGGFARAERRFADVV